MAREMRDSGVEWIGEIPIEWTTTQLKYLLADEVNNIKVGPFGSQLSGNDFIEEGYWVYNQRTVIDSNFKCNDVCISKEKYDSMRGFQVQQDDILITTRGTIGRICRIPMNFYNGIIHPCIIKFRINENKILYSLLELIFNYTDIIKTQLSYKSNATTIDVIYRETLKNIILPLQPLKEQGKIADYLNKKCSEIDSLSTDIQLQINLLEDYKKAVITETVTKGLNPGAEMKDSGIEWIGEIPADWEITTIKRKFTLFSGATPKSEISENWDGDIVWITPADYKTDDKYVSQGRRNISKKGLFSCSATLIPSNSIIFSKRAPIGTVAVNSVPLCTNQGCISIVPKDGVDAIFYYYVMSIYTEQFELYSAGTTFKEISANNFGNFKIVFPLFYDQRKIADYLDKKCAEIDATISEKKEQLEVLEQYKKSLIYEYVTGKKEVCE